MQSLDAFEQKLAEDKPKPKKRKRPAASASTKQQTAAKPPATVAVT